MNLKNLSKKRFYMALLAMLMCIGFSSCEKNFELLHDMELTSILPKDPKPPILYAVPVYNFDWETVDWMPTPPGQSQIPPPWIGQGSLASTFGVDVINDRKASDGWTLLYSTFDPAAPGPLVNPYFILYNKYRGLMRIYFYLTTSFVATSTYLQDGISVVSNSSTSMLNFLGKDIIDATAPNTKMYSQMQAAPPDGSLPLAANKWYMLQYEMAYDPNIIQIPYANIYLSWYLNYYNVTQVNLGGIVQGTLNGIIGSSSSSSSNFFSALTSAGKAVGTGALAIIGQDFLANNTINGTTGENKLGLSNNVFKSLVSGVNSAISSTAGGLPGAVTNILSAIIGGSSGGPTPISLNLNANITIQGTQTNAGSFPSMSTSFYVPGTDISPNAVGYIPAYNETLGVINFVGKPTIMIDVYWTKRLCQDPIDTWVYYLWNEYITDFPSQIDYSNYLLTNPKVLNIADVIIEKQELALITDYHYHDIYTSDTAHGVGGGYYFSEINPDNICWPESVVETGYPTSGSLPWWIHARCPGFLKLGVRFTIKVAPKDGSPISIIIKTFELNHNWNYIQAFWSNGQKV